MRDRMCVIDKHKTKRKWVRKYVRMERERESNFERNEREKRFGI